MNLLRGINPIEAIRQRISAAIGVALTTLICCGVGAFMTFFVSPQQALEWRKIDRSPEIDAAAYAALASGDEAVITGTLTDNEVLTEDFVAYRVDRWVIETTTDSEGTPQTDGDWERVEVNVPALTYSINGGTIQTTPKENISFSGRTAEVIDESNSSTTYEGIPDGSLRTQGFSNGDLVTMTGQKGSTGDFVPDRMFGGDRVELVDNIRSGARAAFAIGIMLMVGSPLFFVAGMFGAVFGRAQRN